MPTSAVPYSNARGLGDGRRGGWFLPSRIERCRPRSWFAAQSRCGSQPAQRLLGLPYSAPAKAPVVRLNRCAACTWQVDPFVKGPLGLLVHDFGARTQPPIAVVEFEAVSAAAYFELVGSWICLRPPTRIPHYVTISVFSAAFLAIRCAARKASLSSGSREGTMAHALTRARDASISRSRLQNFFTSAIVCPVLTAHPTEVRRKSAIDREMEVAHLLAERDRLRLTPEEAAANEEALRRAVLTLWQTSMLRGSRLKVIDEIANGLSYYDYTFLRELPRFYAALEDQLASTDPAWDNFELPSFLRVGSWIGRSELVFQRRVEA